MFTMSRNTFLSCRMSLPGDELRHLRITAVPDCRPVNQNAIKRLNETETGHRLRRPCPAAEQLLGTHTRFSAPVRHLRELATLSARVAQRFQLTDAKGV